MSKIIGNAQNKVDIFRISDSGTAYLILQGLTGSTEATARANKAYTLDMIEEAPIQYQEDGSLKLAFKQIADDKELNTLLNTIAKPSSSSASRPEKVLIDGTKIGGSSSTNQILMIYYGGADETDGRKVTVAIGALAYTSGSHTDKYNEYTNPTVEFNGVITKYDLTIAAALFDATEVNATNVATVIPKIPKGQGYVREFVSLPA